MPFPARAIRCSDRSGSKWSMGAVECSLPLLLLQEPWVHIQIPWVQATTQPNPVLARLSFPFVASHSRDLPSSCFLGPVGRNEANGRQTLMDWHFLTASYCMALHAANNKNVDTTYVDRVITLGLIGTYSNKGTGGRGMKLKTYSDL